METIGIVIPCYNEAKRLKVEVFAEFALNNPHVRLHFVNDGSLDNTQEVLEELLKRSESIFVTKMEKNKGKAMAVHHGVKTCAAYDYDYIAYLDADLSIPLDEINLLYQRMKEYESMKMAFGSRIKTLNNNIERRVFRHIFGRIIATFISNSLKVAVYDTQCGCKLFKKEMVEPLFDKKFISPWLFDVELFWRMIVIYGRARLPEIALEVPLRECIHINDSKVKWTHSFKTFIQLIKIHRFYKNKVKD
ncbi:MAG: glycosyltransferase [Brumimicrobium sp.]